MNIYANMKRRTHGAKQKIRICLKCGKAYDAVTYKKKTCDRLSCGGHVHSFDSDQEYKRFIHLKNNRNVQNLKVQVIFPLMVPVFKIFDGGLSVYGDELFTGKYVTKGIYTADFVYYNSDVSHMEIVEDFKPAVYNTKKKHVEPVIDQRTQDCMKHLYLQHPNKFAYYKSCIDVKSIEGFRMEKVNFKKVNVI